MDILKTVTDIIVEQLGVISTDVIPTATLDELGADSLDRVELVMAFEEEFNVDISDADAETLVTVEDARRLIERLQAAER